MRSLRRIKLINWHLFKNQTIEITNNSLLSGENGAGKSTFLDALQYVLTGGKAKFNTAANTNAKRDLEGYVRCKLGVENKTYLRTNDVTTHVALEFSDNDTSIILGVIIEITKHGRIHERYYVLQNQSITDSLFLNKQVIMGYADFKKNLEQLNVDFTFSDTKEGTRKLFLNVLGIKNYKYIELLPKALAFRPIDELNKFVFDFLLNEKTVDIDSLRQNVRSYREFENLLTELKERERALKDIEAIYNEYQQLLSLQGNLSYLAEYIKIKEIIVKIEEIKQTINIILNKKSESQQRQLDFDIELTQVSKEIEGLKTVLNTNDVYKYYKDIEQRLKENEIELQKVKDFVLDLRVILNNEKTLAAFLKEKGLNNEFSIGNITTSSKEQEVKAVIKEMRDCYEDIKRELNQKIVLLNNRKDSLIEELRAVNEEIALLEKQQFKFDYSVSRLRELIEEDILKVCHKEVKVRVLCELIDVNDEEWRDALEGYLNTQRFDLIVYPEYFDLALNVYEKYKFTLHLNGVGLVNTNELGIYKHTAAGSLAEKISTEMIYARYYVNMLLNNVITVEDTVDLKKYKTAITKTCMVYRNYTARQIREEVYKKPYIGINAIKLQLEKLKNRKQLLLDEKINILKQITDNEFILERILSSQLEYLSSNFYRIADFEKLEKENNALREQAESIANNPKYQTIEAEIRNKQDYYKKCTEEKKQQTLLEGKLSGEENSNRELLEELKAKYDAELVQYNQNTDNEIKAIVEKMYDEIKNKEELSVSKYCSTRILEVNNALSKNMVIIASKLTEYNHTYHTGFSPRVENIADYLNELQRIRNYEILQYEEKARNSRLNCEIAFKEQFICKLRENILSAHEELDNLNRALSGKKFGGDEYEFIYKTSSNYHYETYYNLIMSDSYNESLFVDIIDNENQVILKELFDKLVIDKDNNEAEKSLREFCDYRNYMSYDIRINHSNGDYTMFSKVSREKSGGETQTPFYVVIAASFEQLLRDKLDDKKACFVMFDEAFNNMDESRIESMMQFYANLNIQLMIAVPPQRIDTIIPYVNTTLIVLKDKEESFIETFKYESN